MKIQATFTGRDRGHEKGAKYILNISDYYGSICISTDGRSSGIIYASLAAFLRNWSDIVVIES